MATDIRLDAEDGLTRATDGDAPLVSGADELLQLIGLEAVTQPGDLFYSPDWGWGLYDYLQSADSDMLRLEIAQRIRGRLAEYPELDPAGTSIVFSAPPEHMRILVGITVAEDSSQHTIQVTIDRVTVEVKQID